MRRIKAPLGRNDSTVPIQGFRLRTEMDFIPAVLSFKRASKR